jgi:hypothetical protein
MHSVKSPKDWQFSRVGAVTRAAFAAKRTAAISGSRPSKTAVLGGSEMAIHEQKWMQRCVALLDDGARCRRYQTKEYAYLGSRDGMGSLVAGWVIAKLCPEHSTGLDLYSAKEFNAKAKEWHKLRREAGIEKTGETNEKTV